MTTKDYSKPLPVIGAPFLTVYEDGTIRNAYGKILKFGKDGTTTTIVAGKARRVAREDIFRCVAGGEDLSMLYPKRKHRKPDPGKQETLNRYRQLSRALSTFASSYINNDQRPAYELLYERVQKYVAHFRYTGLDEEYLRDVALESIDALSGLIVKGKCVVAPDRYLIKIMQTKLSQDINIKFKHIDFLL